VLLAERCGAAWPTEAVPEGKMSAESQGRVVIAAAIRRADFSSRLAIGGIEGDVFGGALKRRTENGIVCGLSPSRHFPGSFGRGRAGKERSLRETWRIPCC